MLVPGGERHADPAEERRERHAGELPVPVGGRVDEIDGVRRARDGHERMPPLRTAATSGQRQRAEQQREPDRAELGERLEVEAVGVLHLLACRAVHE